MPIIKYSPSWGAYEKDIYSDDSEKARHAAETFETERAKEVARSPKARSFEKSRREAVAAEKTQWVKARHDKEAHDQAQIINKLRDGGVLMRGMKPAPGLLIIQPNKHELTTAGGLYLPENVEYESSTAKVLRVSDPKMHQGVEEPAPCVEGDEVLYRKGAGLNIRIDDNPCLLIRFDEVLGILE